MTTIYIAPSSGETHHPQARIYRTDRPIFHGSVRDHYRAHPKAWTECGLVNFQGRLVCFDGLPEHRQELVDSQPLMAGTSFLMYP